MFDYNTIIDTSLITTKFHRTSSTEMEVLDKETEVPLGTLTQNEDGQITGTDQFVEDQYHLWAGRPERKVGQLAVIEGKSLDSLMTMYEQLLVGAYLLKFPETAIGPESMYARMLDWLRSTDFYKAPASTIYHESVVGGLLIHSLKVYNEAMTIRRLPKFKNVPVASVALVALVHDWCKISTYESYTRNVKDDKTGQWEKVEAFKRNFSGFTLGHGVTSMFYALKYMDLSEEECAAIRWHMSKWNVCDVEVDELQRCNENFPLVHLLQFADQLSIVNY